MLNLRRKILAATVGARGMSRKNLDSLFGLGRYKPRISESLMRSGLVLAAPLRAAEIPISNQPATKLSSAADINNAKSSLRLMAAAGDGLMGVPWVKGAAGLALEIVNALDAARTNKATCKDLAKRITRILIVIHENTRDGHVYQEPEINDFMRDLQSILKVVKPLSSVGRLRGIWKADTITQQLTQCDQLLN